MILVQDGLRNNNQQSKIHDFWMLYDHSSLNWPGIHQKFVWRQIEWITFLWISSKLSTIGHMLLHNLYINVAIAVLLLYSKSLYDLQKPKCKNPTFAPKGHNWAWSPGVCAAGTDHPPRWFWAGLAVPTIINSQRYMTLEYYSFTRAWIELKFIKNWCGATLRKSVFCEYLQN